MATIRKRGDKYQVQVRRQGCTGISKTFHQLKDAQAWARQAEAQADRNDLGADLTVLRQTTLAALVVRYRDEVVPAKKGARDETIVLNAFLRHPICQKRLSSITSADFASYREERLCCVEAATVKRQLNPIRHMFELARDEWGLPTN